MADMDLKSDLDKTERKGESKGEPPCGGGSGNDQEAGWHKIQEKLLLCKTQKERNTLYLERSRLMSQGGTTKKYAYLILDDLFSIVPSTDEVKKSIAIVAEQCKWISLAKSTYEVLKDRDGLLRIAEMYIDLEKRMEDKDITVHGMTRQQGRDMIGWNNEYAKAIANMEARTRVHLLRELPTSERLALVHQIMGTNQIKELALQASPKHGIGLFAKQDFKKGEVIFKENAFLWHSKGGFGANSNFCSSCSATIHKQNDRGINCPNCGQEHYCSMLCQRAAAHLHALMCPSNVDASLQSTVWSLIVKWLVLMKSRNLTTLNDEKVDVPMSAALDLSEVTGPKKRSIIFGLEDQVRRYNAVVNSAHVRGKAWATMQLYMQLMRRMQRYCLLDGHHSFVPSVYGLFINHDDKPNVGFTFDCESARTPQMVVRALRNIKADEELCISYIPISCKNEETRKALLGSHCIFV